MKIITILGARPQFIKAAAFSRAIKKHNASSKNTQIDEIIIHTGQHFDSNMSEVFFTQLDIPRPNYNLEISNLSHGAMTGRMIECLEKIILDENPDYVLVYGDTNSTLAGAIAAVKVQIPIIHIEAGLRSNNLEMPEESNRILTDRISSMLFCPTEKAIDNLVVEGFPNKSLQGRMQEIINSGDVMLDATLFYRDKAKRSCSLDKWGLKEKEYILSTVHRAENTNSPKILKNIFDAINRINDDCRVVIPIHPRTKKLLESNGNSAWLDNLIVIEPLPYLEMQRLEMGAKSILTDSGGMQKEAFFHNVPCITLRNETEWTETVDMGWNTLAGTNCSDICDAYFSPKKPISTTNPFGNGDSSEVIVDYILNF